MGQGDDLWCIGLTSARPAADARRVAGHLRRCGRYALVAALAPDGGPLSLAAGLERIEVRTISLSSPTADDLAVLARCDRGDGSDHPLTRLRRIADALATLPLGDRFFRAFRTTLTDMREALSARIPVSIRHELVLLQLTRILFLHFVQARGWLDGRPAFLAEMLETCLRREGDLQKDVLDPLFFGTFNLPRERRARRARGFGPLPFLNGGLFERQTIERRWPVVIPTEQWRNAFDDLFLRYHFTGLAGGPESVDPEMLGRVFEGVMDPEERHASGTYYTPPPLVDALLGDALAAWLSRRLGIPLGEAEDRLLDPDGVVHSVMRDIRILDPAVGSGAFLVAALRRLSGLDPEPLSLAQRRRRILASSLHGVDRNPNAVRLTELRLWLELLTGDSDLGPDTLLPLPNLDSAIRQGDSLFAPADLVTAGLPPSTITRLVDARGALEQAHGPDRRPAVRALRSAELSVWKALLADTERRWSDRITELHAAVRSPDLFGETVRSPSLHDALADARQKRREVRLLRQRLRLTGELPWFHYAVQFADTMEDRGGFDLVVGNPPWVRAESLTRGERDRLRGRYRWWTAGPGTRGYRHQPDLSIAFLERAFELARPGGIVGFVLPGKLLTTSYATRARHAMAASATIEVASDLTSDPRARFDATVYPMALVACREPPSAMHAVRTGLGNPEETVSQTRLSGGGPWILLPDRMRDLVMRLQASGPPVGDQWRCHLGVKTGCNRVLLDPPDTLEPTVIRRAVRGRDVGPFALTGGVRLLWGYQANGRVRSQLPRRAAAYCAEHEAVLRERADYRDGPLWQLFRTEALHAEACVVWADLAPQLGAAVLLDPGRSLVPLNTCYLIPAPRRTARALAAWFNSTWIRTLAALVADPAASGYRRFNARVVSSLPCPVSVTSDPTLTEWDSSRSQDDLDEITGSFLNLAPGDHDTLATLRTAAPHSRR